MSAHRRRPRARERRQQEQDRRVAAPAQSAGPAPAQPPPVAVSPNGRRSACAVAQTERVAIARFVWSDFEPQRYALLADGRVLDRDQVLDGWTWDERERRCMSCRSGKTPLRNEHGEPCHPSCHARDLGFVALIIEDGERLRAQQSSAAALDYLKKASR